MRVRKGKLGYSCKGPIAVFAVTTDLWTADNQKRGYMAVTGHFIDDSWMMVIGSIAFGPALKTFMKK